jgi:hypothetical protein
MRTASLLSSLCSLLVIIQIFRTGILEDTWQAKGPYLVLMLLLTVAACVMMWRTPTNAKPVWVLPLVGSSLVLARVVYWMYTKTFIDYPMADISITYITLVVPALIALVTMPIVKLVDYNPYRVTSGKVVGGTHWLPSTSFIGIGVPGTIITNVVPISTGDSWSLQIQDEAGHVGRVYVSQETFNKYDKGTQYP